MSQDHTIFEYLVGSLSLEERDAFDAQLRDDPILRQKLQQWEHRFSMFNQQVGTREVSPEVWKGINRRIEKQRNPSTKAGSFSVRSIWLAWLTTATAVLLLAITLIFSDRNDREFIKPPVDYVAVLTNQNGQSVLTALTQGENQRMWLQWSGIELPKKRNLQIWAKSRRDQQVRSIAVVDDISNRSVTLSDAHWRLIKDAEYLLLTLEEEGGSVIDEPSEELLAQGICVRLDAGEKS